MAKPGKNDLLRAMAAGQHNFAWGMSYHNPYGMHSLMGRAFDWGFQRAHAREAKRRPLFDIMLDAPRLRGRLLTAVA